MCGGPEKPRYCWCFLIAWNCALILLLCDFCIIQTKNQQNTFLPWHRWGKSLICAPLCTAQQINGGRSSVGRAPDCDSGCRGFKSHRPPHLLSDMGKVLENSSHVFAEVVELVDTLDLGSSASRRESSSLSFRTIIWDRWVAQLGSALVLGTRGRRFKSCLTDHLKFLYFLSVLITFQPV